MNKWICTDSESTIEEYTQYVKQLTKTKFHVVEHDTIYIDNIKKYIGREQIVDLNDYTEEEILEELKSYGYDKRQDLQIEAECIAEQDMETDIITGNFQDIINWKLSKGIIIN